MWPAVLFPRATGGRHTFFVLFFFPLPQFWLLVLSKTPVTAGWEDRGLAGSSCVVFMLSDLENASGPVSSQPLRRKQLGITPTFRTSCWQAQGVTSDAFHSSPIGGRHFPLANRICLVGRAGRDGQAFQPSEDWGEVFTARF